MVTFPVVFLTVEGIWWGVTGNGPRCVSTAVLSASRADPGNAIRNGAVTFP